MNEPERNPTEDDVVAARLIVNMLVASAHDSRAEIAMKTGIDARRLEDILTARAYPDWYEIAKFERAYQRRLWPESYGG